MALFKCKMCGGNLEIAEGTTIAECEYCGTKQTVPKGIDENLQNLFNRANNLRMKGEFDKAEQIYEKIIQADSTQSEAYWGLILCKYGIEYVDDPKTYKKIPTCHRASYDSIIADDDYKSAIELADTSQRILYEEQAKEIDRIQKDILALAQKEESYDVFICYKETDTNGKRTQDSVIANDIYHQLTQEGFKVFYAAITLEDKLGSAYEPIIFAALNSAKVMLVIGTNPEYFNAVWVKNEWSRYLKIIKQDHSKLLIPCYRDMDAYELPEEFAHLQSQDMSKIGFINDIVRGITKVIKKDEPKPQTDAKETVVTASTASNTAPLLERAFMFLEDSQWQQAKEYCNKVLDIEPKNALAYLGIFMASSHIKTRTEIPDTFGSPAPLNQDADFQKAMRFADNSLREELDGYVQAIDSKYNTGHRVSSKSEITKDMLHIVLAQDVSETAFAGCATIEKATILDGVKSIGKNAFWGCKGLTSITIPDSVTSIGEGAFRECTGLTGITIPDSVTSIGEGAFRECTGLTSITIPDSATSIGESAFYKCTGLKSITIPNGVKSIGSCMFSNCSALTGITIPASVTGIGNYAFNRCTGLTSINIPERVTSIGKGAFHGCTGLTSITIPSSAPSIGEGAFNSCTGLTSITIPSSVKSIGENAFFACTSLTSVTILDGVTSIGGSAFWGCKGLKSITIPESVTSIGRGAFLSCDGLTSITIPASFKDNKELGLRSQTTITYSGQAPQSGGGCYVATCVYGSYDCPQVWTLRRFRDDTLGATWYGRAFIRTYYAISPTLVKWFGETSWFKRMWQGTLDKMVAKLNSDGVADTPYQDKDWR